MKTKCTFLPLAAICRKIKHSFIFISISRTCYTERRNCLLSYARSMGCTPSDMQLLQELGERSGHRLSKRAHSNGNDLVVNLGVDCSREVDICLQNRRSRFIDL